MKKHESGHHGAFTASTDYIVDMDKLARDYVDSGKNWHSLFDPLVIVRFPNLPQQLDRLVRVMGIDENVKPELVSNVRGSL